MKFVNTRSSCILSVGTYSVVLKVESYKDKLQCLPSLPKKDHGAHIIGRCFTMGLTWTFSPPCSPNDADIERPIGLMGTRHKALTRLRWSLIEDWVCAVNNDLWYDACATLDVSLKCMIFEERARYPKSLNPENPYKP